MRLRRSWLCVFACCALAGLIVTVGLAWLSAACVQMQNERQYPEWSNQYGSLKFGGFEWRGLGAERVRWGLNMAFFSGAGFGPGEEGEMLRAQAREILPSFQANRRFPHWWGTMPTLQRPSPWDESPEILQDARGWPVVALWCEWNEGVRHSLSSVHGGINLSPAGQGWPDHDVRALPCRPAYLGLAVDTSIFGTACFAIFSLGRWIHRCARRKPGRCAQCGYDLTGNTSGICSECGARHTETAATKPGQAPR